MDPTPENVVYHELVGLPVEIESPGYRLKGVVVDETRNMLTVQTAAGDRKVPKDAGSFTFTLPDGRRVRVRGTLLRSQPENRIPKRKKRGK